MGVGERWRGGEAQSQSQSIYYSINLFSFLPLGFSAEPMLSTSFSFRHLLSNKYMKTLLICVYTALYRTAQRAFKKKDVKLTLR